MSSRLIESTTPNSEPLVDVALAEIDELPGGALGIGHLQRARFLQVFEFGGKPRRAIKRARLVECAADVREFLRRRDNDPGERARSRFRHPADEPDAEVRQHVARVPLATEDDTAAQRTARILRE